MRPSARNHVLRSAMLAALLTLPAAEVFAACTITAVTSLVFGTYNGTTNTVTGSFSVGNCQASRRSYTATLSAGSSGNAGNRTMKSGSNLLLYNLYTDSLYSTVWPSTGPGVSGTGSTSSSGALKTIYGRIPAGQDVSVGNYSEPTPLTITITF